MPLFRFRRSKPKPAGQPPPNATTLGGLSELLQSWLSRMQELVAARETAAPWHLPDIDAQIDQLCQEAAEKVARPHTDELSERLQRMQRLVLEEMFDMRDKARR